MIYTIDDEVMTDIKYEAYRRWLEREQYGMRNKPVWKHANDCIGEWVVCAAVGVDWSDFNVLAEQVGIVVFHQSEYRGGLGLSNSKSLSGTYVLVTPAYDLTKGNAYVIRGWIPGDVAFSMSGKDVVIKPKYRIVKSLFPAETLWDFVWHSELPQYDNPSLAEYEHREQTRINANDRMAGRYF